MRIGVVCKSPGDGCATDGVLVDEDEQGLHPLVGFSADGVEVVIGVAWIGIPIEACFEGCFRRRRRWGGGKQGQSCDEQQGKSKFVHGGCCFLEQKKQLKNFTGLKYD